MEKLKPNSKLEKIRDVLRKNNFVEFEDDDNYWVSKNNKYFVILNEKTITLTEKISDKEYLMIEENVFFSNLSKVLKKYEVKNV